MFSLVSDASKVALVHLCRTLEDRGFGLIDCQMATDHLLSLGAFQIPRAAFTASLDLLCADPGTPGLWNIGGAATGVADFLALAPALPPQDRAGS